MIFTGFKRKSNQIFFNNRLPNWLKKSKVNSTNKVKSILVFLDDISKKEEIHTKLVSLLAVYEGDIKLIGFQQNISKEHKLKDSCTPKDFGWYGKIKSEELKSALTKKYDLLINYSKVDNLYLNLLLLQCKTEFKVGFSHLDSRLYDLMIDCKFDDLEVFNKELKKYLAILNKL